VRQGSTRHRLRPIGAVCRSFGTELVGGDGTATTPASQRLWKVRRRAGAASLRLPLSLALKLLRAGRADAGRDDPPYFLVVGFLALGWQHEGCAGLAELVLGLLPLIAGLLTVVAGLGVPFQGCIVVPQSRLRQSKAGLPAQFALEP
jgi:hypothetical protein